MRSKTKDKRTGTQMRKLFSRKDISNTVTRLACMIEKDFPDEEILFVCLLKGSFIFTSDLIRSIRNPSRVDFMRVSSYGNGMVSSGSVTITKDLEEKIEGKTVIIVEDIIDSGITLAAVRDILSQRNPRHLRICALVDKKARREVPVEGDYVGFTIEDGFIVGYGIDHAEAYRNYPEIYVIES